MIPEQKPRPHGFGARTLLELGERSTLAPRSMTVASYGTFPVRRLLEARV